MGNSRARVKPDETYYAATFDRLLRDAPPVGWVSSPVHISRHEGTFYPLSLLRAFVRVYNGSIFEAAADAQQAGDRCYCW